MSKTSVSRYLGEERKLLSDDLRERIEASIKRLGFKPDRIASSMRGRRTRLIGMVVADMLNPYTVAMMHGAETACREQGYSLVVCNTDRDDELERRHLDVLRAYSVEGLIVNTQGRNVDMLQELSNEGLPMVMVDRRVSELNVDMVGLDNHHAVSLATSHLLDQGYRDILLISEPIAGISTRQERSNGFQYALQACQDAHGDIIEVALTTPDALTEALKHFMQRPGAGPKALLSANGVVTTHICHVLRRHDSISFDTLGLIGIDELDWCALLDPGISTVAQPTQHIGQAAVDQLLARLSMSTRPIQHQLFEGSLNIRGSTRAR